MSVKIFERRFERLQAMGLWGALLGGSGRAMMAGPVAMTLWVLMLSSATAFAGFPATTEAAPSAVDVEVVAALGVPLEAASLATVLDRGDAHGASVHDDDGGLTHNVFVHEKGVSTAKELFNTIYKHISPHWYVDGVFSNHHAAFLLAFLVVFVLFSSLARSRRKSLQPSGRVQNLLETLVLFVRDEMVYGTMGKTVGQRFLPLFLSQFFMILVMNLFGILPSFGTYGHSVGFPTTATANLMVTGGLAMMTFCVIFVAGVKEQGFGLWVTNLAPSVELGPGAFNAVMKKVVLGILYPIEILGLIIKPMALMIRLFANMTGGHMALLTIYGLSYFALSMMDGLFSIPIAVVALAVNVFLTFLELLVAVLQAYIFTYLSIIFVNASVHPDH